MVYYLLDYLIINYLFFLLENIVLFDAISTIKGKDSFEKIRVVAFATKKGLEMLAAGRKWFVDGTFQSVPKNFYQLLTFHAIYKQRTWPCLHALCSAKTAAVYHLLYHQIKLSFAKNGLQGRPRSINVDFELAMIKTIREQK